MDLRLEQACAFYARLAAAGGGEVRVHLEQAFLEIRREDFLGPGPWSVVGSDEQYHPTPTVDPIHIYQNVRVALNKEKRINNGEPFLHGRMIGALAPRRGERVLHVGCGTGYYTAILAALVGSTGQVVAYEIEADLAFRAQSLLKSSNIQVVQGTGSDTELTPADGIYVSAGATRPAGAWLDALAEGGRLVFPLGGVRRTGVALRILRQGNAFAVEVLSFAWFIPCQGAFDDEEAHAVMKAFRTGALFRARSLRRDGVPDESVVLAGKGWWLSSAAIA